MLRRKTSFPPRNDGGGSVNNVISIKNNEQIKIMREAGRICALAHEAIAKVIEPGICTLELANVAEKIINKHGATPTFKGYDGFPGSICISINDEVIHGIPGKKRKIADGDVVSVDIGAYFRGFNGDMARTNLVGNVDAQAIRLLEVTKSAFYAGMMAAIEGNRVRDISEAVQKVASQANVGIVRDYVGHGVGEHLHEDPEIPNFVDKKKGIRLYNGMTLAIEPMLNLGTGRVHTLDNGWTVATDDGKISCHYENSIAITNNGPIILTEL